MRPSLVRAIAVIGLLGMSCGRSATSPENEEAGSSTTSEEDEDKPDQSAPVSGAYLTCLAPEPTPEMNYMVAGCQLRDSQHRHMEKDPNTRWAFAAADGKAAPAIEVYELYDKTQHYFDAMFVMRFPAGASLQGFNRLAAVDAFLSSVPVLAPKAILLSSVKKTDSLNLLGAGIEEEAATADAMTFRRHNTAVDTERTMPADPVSGIRGRPFVIPQVIEVNGQPVLPQLAQTTATPTSVALTPEQQAQQQQQVQNQLNAQMFSTLISGASQAIAAGAAAQPAQTGVVRGPPPAKAGGCTCQN